MIRKKTNIDYVMMCMGELHLTLSWFEPTVSLWVSKRTQKVRKRRKQRLDPETGWPSLTTGGTSGPLVNRISARPRINFVWRKM